MSQCNVANRSIFCSDNLDILYGINSNSIDLIYLDPPFNKKKVFTAPVRSSSEGASFSDIFREEDVKDDWIKTIKEDQDRVYHFLMGIKDYGNLYNYCYLSYMAIRLLEMHRILKDTGSLYLHCDPTMSHYLKILLDCIFGESHFRNEVVWGYRTQGVSKKWWPRKHDIIFMYVKTNHYTYHPTMERQYYKKPFRHTQIDDKNRHYVDSYLRDIWDHDETKPPISQSQERTGYPTQKPLALLERIIQASSNEGDVVLDPFCGCATTCIASEKLNRKWIGIDVSIKAYELLKQRLEKEIADTEHLLDTKKDLHFSTEAPKRTDIDTVNSINKKYVYIISNQALFPNEYKVGIAKDWKSRFNGYQTFDPNRAYKMEYKILTPNFRQLEKHIHSCFPNRQEWVRAELSEIIDEMEKQDGKIR